METINQVAAILAVLGLLSGALWWLRRRGLLHSALPRRAAPSGGRRLEILERLPLGPQQTLHLVRLGSRALLLALTPTGCALLESVEVRNLERASEALQ